MVTDGDAPPHLGPLAKLSGLLTGEQLQLLIESVERHYRTRAARRAAGPRPPRSAVQYPSPVNAESLWVSSGHRQHSIRAWRRKASGS